MVHCWTWDTLQREGDHIIDHHASHIRFGGLRNAGFFTILSFNVLASVDQVEEDKQRFPSNVLQKGYPFLGVKTDSQAMTIEY